MKRSISFAILLNACMFSGLIAGAQNTPKLMPVDDSKPSPVKPTIVKPVNTVESIKPVPPKTSMPMATNLTATIAKPPLAIIPGGPISVHNTLDDPRIKERLKHNEIPEPPMAPIVLPKLSLPKTVDQKPTNTQPVSKPLVQQVNQTPGKN